MGSAATGHTFDAFWRCSHQEVFELVQLVGPDIPLMPFGVEHLDGSNLLAEVAAGHTFDAFWRCSLY